MTTFLSTTTLRRVLPVILILLAALLSACNGSDNDGESTLGVPGAGNDSTVTVSTTMVEAVSGTATIVSTFINLGNLGYEQAEYFVSGTANAYTNVNELDSDGNWQVEASEQAEYLTRVVVYRPIDPEDFNGTVLLEWFNVSAGFDTAPDWNMTHTELIRSGYAYVGISVQKVGVDALVSKAADGLLGIDSGDRYSALVHPGDSFSYDIYSQVAQAIRTPGAESMLGQLTPEHLIAAGESQSAGRMMTYVNAFAPIHALFDGYFVHSRTGSSSSLAQSPQESIPAPEVVRVRTDLGTPVLMLQTETDLFLLNAYPSNQDDSSNFRLWEVAGTAHADLYTFLASRLDNGTNPAVAAVVEDAAPIPGIIDCDKPVNAGPQHFVANAAIDALNSWIINGTPAPMAERLVVAGAPASFVLDERGNVEGGIRTPYVDAPIAILSGEGQSGEGFCFLSGTTELFDTGTLGSLYADNDAYIDAVNTSTDDTVASGFLLPADAELIKDYAASTDIFSP